MASELGQLFDQLKPFKRPAVESWHPVETVDFDLRIARNGDWLHQGGIITRRKLVKLFSTVLAYRNGDYYLVTPPVKYRIQVEDAPFLGVEVSVTNSGVATNQALQEIFIRTNMDDVVRLDQQHPLNIVIDPDTGEPAPYIEIRDGLKAKLTRPVFYELAEMCVQSDGASDAFGVFSAGEFFALG